MISYLTMSNLIFLLFINFNEVNWSFYKFDSEENLLCTVVKLKSYTPTDSPVHRKYFFVLYSKFWVFFMMWQKLS